MFDEGFTGTVWLIAAKAADPQVDHGLPARDRKIGEVALIAAVERFRPSAAFRAACAYRFAADGNMDNFVPQLHSLDNEPSARRQYQLRIHRPPFGWPGDPPGRSVLPGQPGATQVARQDLDILIHGAENSTIAADVCAEANIEMGRSNSAPRDKRFQPIAAIGESDAACGPADAQQL